MKKIIVLLFTLTYFTLPIQSQIGVGEWRAHLPYSKTYALVESSDKIFCATGQSIFSYSKQNNNIEKLNTVNSLSDVEVTSLGYNPESNQVLVGYKNGNFDILTGYDVFNIPAIKNKPLTGSKSINSIFVENNLAFLACGFGIVVIDLERKEVKDTYLIGDLGSQLNIHQITIFNSYIYAATNNGIYRADYYASNLADYSFWERMMNIPSFESEFNALVKTPDYLIANLWNGSLLNDQLFIFNGTVWTSLNQNNLTNHKLHVANNHLFIISNSHIEIFDFNLQLQESIEAYNNQEINPRDAIMDINNTIWIADEGFGLVRYSSQIEYIIPNGPYTNKAYSISTQNGKIYVAAGGVNPSWNNVFTPGMIFRFGDEHWNSTFNYEANDAVKIAIDPYDDDHYFVGTWGSGVLEYRGNDLIETYLEENSSLESITDGADFIRVHGMDFDRNNNLWMSNSQISSPISVLSSDGWSSFDFEGEINNALCGELIVTQSVHIWVIMPKGGGLFVFNPNGTIENTNDDEYMKLSVLDETGTPFTNDIYSIAEDNDGEIWVGTNQGVVVYYSPQGIFDEEIPHANRILLTIDGHTQRLLQNEVVTAIAIDGANRKWFGTASSGVFLTSEDGTESISHFTRDNSPLLSNNITSIGIDHESGEVFFGTDKGLISYRGSATMGSDEFKDVYVYPNPVRENYNGDITIRGLVSDVNVKITDIGGNIVYETQAEGGQAIWDGKNFNGRRVNTGVYLVFCTNDDGSKTHITKLLFIK